MLSLLINAEDTLISKIKHCQEQSSNEMKLLCYDTLASTLGVYKKITKKKPKKIQEKTPEVLKSKWNISETISEIDDSKEIFMTLESTENIYMSYNRVVRPTLILRCSENTTNAYVTWDVFLGMDNTKVLTRIDKGKAKTNNWTLSTDNKATFAPQNIKFIKSLFKHNKLLLKLTPYSESPITTTFDITNTEKAVTQLRETCHW